MKINQNNDISIFRGETAAIDFRMSQRSDYYVPFLISSARVNPMVCISIGSTRRESKNIVSKQLWLELTSVPKFSQTVVEDLGIIEESTDVAIKNLLNNIVTSGKMYQFKKQSEVDANIKILHFAYEPAGATSVLVGTMLTGNLVLDTPNSIQHGAASTIYTASYLLAHVGQIHMYADEALGHKPIFTITDGILTNHGVYETTLTLGEFKIFKNDEMYLFVESDGAIGINNIYLGEPIQVVTYIPESVSVYSKILIDEYNFTVIMALDDTITLDMTGNDYFYQIELMDTVPMLTHLQSIFTANPTLITKLPTGFVNTSNGITEYLEECIALVTKTFPNHWGYRITNPLTSPVASVSNIQMLQPPRKFTVQSVVK